MGHHVFIDPLPLNFTDHELKTLFEQFGRVMRVVIPYDSAGESMRFGYVEMETEEAADMACTNLARTRFRDQVLTVLKVSANDIF